MSHPAVKAQSSTKVIPIVDASLYEVQKKIYPRAVSGMFRTWRWFFVWATQCVFYGLCWLPWNGRQAVLFDLVERKFYLFGLVLWPQDVFYLAVLLIICALSLFLFTAIAGRLWCGYACPQTVYTEIFLWLERAIEGDRAARMKLDAQPMGARKFVLKAAKHSAWMCVGLWTGITFVGYFTPIKSLLSDLAVFTLGPWQAFWIFFYGFATYGNAGFMREQVCKYMCPYARFQGVMFDRDTLIVTYDASRGEPRGRRSKSVDTNTSALGDCIDCGLCVQVCPTGIDIRNGLQYECIGCSACIDACNKVMDKMAYPRNLICYATENAIQKHWQFKDILSHVIRPRTAIYGLVLLAISTAFVWSIIVKVPLKVDVIRDRVALVREVEDGRIENVYRLQVMNLAEKPRVFSMRIEGLPHLELVMPHEVSVPAAATMSVTVRVRGSADEGRHGANHVDFVVRAMDDEAVVVREKTSFLVP